MRYPSQGRPFGLMAAWLQAGSGVTDKALHGKVAPSQGGRSAAMVRIANIHACDALFAKDMDRREDEPMDPESKV